MYVPARALLAMLVLLSVPAPALGASSFQKIYADFQKTGRIDGCRYSSATLKQAKSDIPKDFEQYSPDFENALDAALQKRATGGCKSAGSSGSSGGGNTSAGGATSGSTPGGGTSTPPAPAPTPAQPSTPSATGATGPSTPVASQAGTTPQPTPAPSPAAAASDAAIAEAATSPASSTSADETPAPLVLLALLALLALAAGAMAYAWRSLGWDPFWLARGRHATAEAGWRVGNVWSEFSDWVRMGR